MFSSATSSDSTERREWDSEDYPADVWICCYIYNLILLWAKGMRG